MNTKSERPSYTCPRCGAVSYHPKDLEYRYCVRCHKFEDDAAIPPAIARVYREARDGTLGHDGTGYNRTYHRHNRS